MLDSLLRNESTTFAGKYYQLQGAYVRPRPVQQPRPPLTLGAHWPRMLRICAEYADAWNSLGTVEEIRERNRILDEQCAAIGRDPRTIWRSFYGGASQMASQRLPDPWSAVSAFEEIVGRYSAAGIKRVHHRSAAPRAVPGVRAGRDRRDSRATLDELVFP